MMIGRVRKKFDKWREEPEHVRMRIATMLTVGSGAVISLLWLFVLLPMQIRFDLPFADELMPATPQETEAGAVSGIQDTLPSPSATPQYYNGTRPGFRTEPSLLMSPTPETIPSPTPSPTPEPTGGLPVTE